MATERTGLALDKPLFLNFGAHDQDILGTYRNSRALGNLQKQIDPQAIGHAQEGRDTVSFLEQNRK
jgi:hypothetical protein